MMDVSSVQKTRLTFTLVSTPMLVAQHGILATQIFSDEVICALSSWVWPTTLVIYAPLIGVSIMHAVRAYEERDRYSPTIRSIHVKHSLHRAAPHIKVAANQLLDSFIKSSNCDEDFKKFHRSNF